MTKLNKRQLDFALNLKSVDSDGTFKGYGSVFGVVDAYNERVMPGAFKKSIQEKGPEGVAMLWQHQASTPIGVYTLMREDDRGLYVEGRLSLETEKGREAHALMLMGWKAGLSIGFVPEETNEADDGVDEITALDLWELSIVTFPANAESMVEQVRAKIAAGQEPTKRDIERLLVRDAGLSRSKAAALIASGYNAMTDTRDADGRADEMWRALANASQN